MRRQVRSVEMRSADPRAGHRIASAAIAALISVLALCAREASSADAVVNRATASSPSAFAATSIGFFSTRLSDSLSLLTSRDAPRVSESWLAGAERQIAEREYRATPTARGLQAPNRRHNLRTYFEADGIRVVDRSAAGSPELVGLRAVALGRGERLDPLGPGAVASEGARVEIRRAGSVEWFLNSDSGLEHGFDLAARPAGRGPLCVDLEFDGASARVARDHVAFTTASGRRLRYAKLVAFDASGRTLPAHFEAPSPRRLRLAIDDAGARYPLHIDPLLSASPDAQLESDQENALLGHSVAAAGDVDGDGYADVIVGAYGYDSGENNEGAAFVFRGSATGLADANPAGAATQLEGNQIGASFGHSVAGAGDVNGDGYADVIVGSNLYDAPSQNEGAAFVFHGSATGIADGNPATAATQLESDQADAFFGFRVAGAGDVNGDGYADVIVGCLLYDGGLENEGGAFVFHGSATGIADATPATAATRIESNQLNAQLGHAVAGARDLNGDGYSDILVSAILYDAGESDEGAVFVYHGSASGIAHGDPSTAVATLQANQNFAGMGYSVAGVGDVNGDGYGDVIASATGYSNGEANEGAAWLFHGSATGVANGNPLNAAAQLEANQAQSNFGQSVAGAGDVNGDGYADVIVSAVLYDDPEIDEGAAFVFLGGASGVGDGNPDTAFAVLEANQSGALYGRSVAGLGDVNGDGYADVAVGAPFFANGQSIEGTAFVYNGGSRGIRDGNPGTAATELQGDRVSIALGLEVAAAGDVNGDGYGDVLVSATDFDSGEANEGVVFVFQGSASGIASGNPASAAALLESNQSDSGFGRSAASAGDVNGDGYGDVIIGADGYDSGQSDEGAAFVFLGSATGIPDGSPATAATVLQSNQVSASFGASVAGAGDVNGDGYADVVVGSYQYDSGQNNEGAAFVFHGSASGLVGNSPANAALRIESDQATALLGYSVASAGDIDGDGYADLAVGAVGWSAGESNEGALLIFRGSAGGIRGRTPLSAHARMEANQAGALLGTKVASAGDIDSDGYADLLVAAPGYAIGAPVGGTVFLFRGSATGIAGGDVNAAPTRIHAQAVGTAAGHSLGGAGDLDGDGFGDIFIGASDYNAGSGSEGAVFVFRGSATGIASAELNSAAARLDSNQSLASFGISAAGAGDLNGDGFADLIVGSPGYDDGEFGEGAAFAFLGGEGLGRDQRPAQLRGDGSGTAVQPWGHSNDSDAFAVALTATPSEGRARAKLEIEACPNGVAFGSLACAHQIGASWSAVPVGTAGLRLSETVSGLSPAVRYHWRARVLYAPLTATQPGVVPPPTPAHGPWRRVQAQSVEADLRVVPEPGALAGLAAGSALAAALARRRHAAARR